jgi:hypothetical protein
VLPVADEAVNATLPHLPAIVANMVRFQRLTGWPLCGTWGRRTKDPSVIEFF